MGIAERKEREKAERRKAILDAARKLIKERIFEEITMEEIARELELSRATLYLYFRNKSEIYITLIIEGMQELLESYKTVNVQDIEDPVDRLKAMALVFFTFYKENSSYFDLIITKRDELMKDSGEEKVAEYQKIGALAIEPYITLYKDGVAEGTFADLPSEKMAYVLRALGIGLAVGWREGTLNFPEDINLLDQLLLYGMKGQKKPE